MPFELPTCKYIAFIDETGDHNLESLDPNYPVFAICAQTTKVADYREKSHPNLNKLKRDVFENEDIILHGHKIRQRKKNFVCLKDEDKYMQFVTGMTTCFKEMDGKLIAAAIDKAAHKKAYKKPENPFFLSLQFVLERLHMNWTGALSANEKLHCVIEARGGKEDDQTEVWFEEICAGKNFSGQIFHFTHEFQPKSENIAGHQYVDLAAYAIARYVETRDPERRDWVAVKDKLRKSWWGKMEGYGLKIFP